MAGDLDGDGEAEIVAAENDNEGDVRHTSAVAVHKLDGTLLWTRGDPGVGRNAWHHDVACQIHDWDGDGRDEVVAGYALLNVDGSVRWVYQSGVVDQDRGHLDCARTVHIANQPEETRLVLTSCGANNTSLF